MFSRQAFEAPIGFLQFWGLDPSNIEEGSKLLRELQSIGTHFPPYFQSPHGIFCAPSRYLMAQMGMAVKFSHLHVRPGHPVRLARELLEQWGSQNAVCASVVSNEVIFHHAAESINPFQANHLETASSEPPVASKNVPAFYAITLFDGSIKLLRNDTGLISGRLSNSMPWKVSSSGSSNISQSLVLMASADVYTPPSLIVDCQETLPLTYQTELLGIIASERLLDSNRLPPEYCEERVNFMCQSMVKALLGQQICRYFTQTHPFTQFIIIKLNSFLIELF